MDRRPERSTFLLYWCLACTSSMVFSRLVPLPPYLAAPGILFSCLLGVLLGASLGLAQWWVLRFPSAVRWIGFTTLGLVLSIAGSMVIGIHGQNSGEPPPLWFLRAGLLSLPIGFMQWLVLRKYIPRAGWWIPMSCVAWSLAGGLDAALNFGVIPIMQSLPDWLSRSLGLGLGGLALGAVSGVFMSRLLYGGNIPGTWLVRLFELK